MNLIRYNVDTNHSDLSNLSNLGYESYWLWGAEHVWREESTTFIMSENNINIISLLWFISSWEIYLLLSPRIDASSVNDQETDSAAQGRHKSK